MTAENDSGATPESPIRTMKQDLGRWIVTVAILMVAVAAAVSTLLTLLVVSLTDTDDGVEASQTAILEPVAAVAAEEPVAVDPPANGSDMEMDSRPEPPIMEYEQFPEPEFSDMLLMMFFMMMAMADQEAYPPPWPDYGYQDECYYESCEDYAEPYYEYDDAKEEYYEYDNDYSQYPTEGDFYGMPSLPGEGWDPEVLALYIELLELLSQSFPADDFG